MEQPEAERPKPRYGHSFTKVGAQYVLYGGVDNQKVDGQVMPKGDIYTCSIVKNKITWSKKTATGDIPLPRTQHLAVELDSQNLLIFGGIYSNKTRLNDVAILNVPTMTWKVPPGHTLLTDPKNEPSKINGPEPRASCAGCIYKDKLYVFGGLGGTFYTKKVFNDLFELDLKTFKWTCVDYKNVGRPAEPRCGHSMFAANDMLYAYGGWNNETQF